MPVLTQLNLNIGTEQNPNMVLHDLHDIRISSTDVTTVTRLLGCDAGVNSIAPITLANAASLLGETVIANDGWGINISTTTDMNNMVPSGNGHFYSFFGGETAPSNLPSAMSSSNRFFIEVFQFSIYDVIQRVTSRSTNVTYQRYGTGFTGSRTWTAWEEL